MFAQRAAPRALRALRSRAMCAQPIREAVPPVDKAASASQKSAAGAVSKEVHASEVITARVKPSEPAPPSMNSTELGAGDIGDIPDPHTNDPLKWKKAAWKYVGAVGVFAVAYKGLHWYVDALEAEARRRREDVEASKTAVFETAADRAARREEDARKAQELLDAAVTPLGKPGDKGAVVAAAAVAGAESADGEAPKTEALEGEAEEIDSGFQVFKPVSQTEGYVSPEDELRVLELELEARLKKLRDGGVRSREIDAEKRQIKDELSDLRAELKMFEAKAMEKAKAEAA